MRWDLILPGLSALLAQLCSTQVGDRDGRVQAGRPDLKARLFWTLSSVSAFGVDELRYTNNVSDPNQQDLTICGWRDFTLSLRCESMMRNETHIPQWYLERIRTRLMRPESAAALLALNVSFISAGPTRDISAPKSQLNHVEAVAQMDLFFTTAVNDLDDDAAQPTPTIGIVNITGTGLGQTVSVHAP